MIEWFTQHYISKPEDIYNPLMSPVFAKDFSSLPPAFILTGACDPLKDDLAIIHTCQNITKSWQMTCNCLYFVPF